MHSILWRGLFFPGYEACRLLSEGSTVGLDGSAIFSHEEQPCKLDYKIVCDSGWRTLSASVQGWMGSTEINIQLKTDSDQRWWMNEVEQPQVAGCTDIDLNFSPSTNLLPIRRCGLAVGESADVKAAWLRFPSFELELLSQEYRRLHESIYRYESAGGEFVAELKVDRSGFVVEYPGLWQAEAISGE